jgi:hypothetical protein
MKKYCSSAAETFDFAPANFTMPLVDNSYSAKNVYCQWTFSKIDTDEFILIEYYKYDNRQLFSVEGEFWDGSPFSYDISRSNFLFNARGVKFFSLHFVSGAAFSIPPFVVKMSYQKVSRSFISVFLSVGTIVVLVGLFCILAYRCYYAIKMRNRLRIEGQQHEREINYILANNPGIMINFDQHAQIEAILKNKNKNAIEKLLETEIKPIIYKESLNEFKSSCTICMEVFAEEKSEVTVLYCKHVFHYNCLKSWLYKNLVNPKCPNCNYNVVDKSSNPPAVASNLANTNHNNHHVNQNVSLHDHTHNPLNNVSSNIMIVNSASGSTTRRNNDNSNNNRYVSVSGTRSNMNILSDNGRNAKRN